MGKRRENKHFFIRTLPNILTKLALAGTQPVQYFYMGDNQKMKNTILAIMIAALSLAITSYTSAGIIINITEQNGHVVISSPGGSINTTGLNIKDSGAAYDGVAWHGYSYAEAGFSADGYNDLKAFDYLSSDIKRITSDNWTYTQDAFNDHYSDITFTQGSTAIILRYWSHNEPTLYLSNSAITGINIIAPFTAITDQPRTLASMGYTPNQFVTYSWRHDFVTFNTNTIPEPASALLLALPAFLIKRKRT